MVVAVALPNVFRPIANNFAASDRAAAEKVEGSLSIFTCCRARRADEFLVQYCL